MVFNDLREWISEVEKTGKVLRVAKADRDKEMGTIYEILARKVKKRGVSILFDDIPNFKKGYRCLFSNYDDPKAKKEALLLGAKDYLIKTKYTPGALLEEIKKYISD